MVKPLRLVCLATAGLVFAGAARPDRSVAVAFRNVHLRMGEGIILEVRHLEGALVSTKTGQPPVFDDQRSFTLRVDSGEIAMTPASLTRLLNEHASSRKGRCTRACACRSPSLPTSRRPPTAASACTRPM
jgi:hypothetical protein